MYNPLAYTLAPIGRPTLRSTDEPVNDTPNVPDVSLPDQEEFYRPPARFGNIPVEAEPLGWDRNRRFEKHYPRIQLPMQITERVSFGRKDVHEPNRLIWGDNLHVMRQLPSNSIDLIYIDPPFFSGRQYNVMWGDNHEMRSFNDIWEGGMTGYLIWLNARLYEMKRLLKPTGSIYVHCDWHASHYIKVEMDKIFGYDNFKNEVVWGYRGMPSSASKWQSKHDVLLFYAASKHFTFNLQLGEPTEGSKRTYASAMRRGYNANHRRMMVTIFDKRKYRAAVESGKIPPGMRETQFKGGGAPLRDWWEDIKILGGPGNRERIGYPTQKPEALLERIILAPSNENNTVLDVFMGGGTTIAVAQRLGRRWIGCDQSRVAVAVTAERLKQQSVTRGLQDAHALPDFTVEQWGIYEANRLSQMPSDEFRQFVLHAYGVTRISNDADDGPHIHGWHNQRPVWVGESALASQATADDVRDFANAIRRTTQYRDANLRDGTMLAWGFHPDARTAADRLRQQANIDVDFVRLAQIRIGDAQFREHIVGSSTDRADYSEFLTFVQQPIVEVAYRALGGGAVTFDAGDTIVINPDAEIINVQWDFDYRERFAATPGYSFKRDRRTKKPELKLTHKFNRTGKFKVACRVQDSRGGEGMKAIDVEVK